MRGLGPFLKDAWRLTRPYFMTSEEKWSARGMLLGIIAMNLTLVGLSVILSYWRREFYNALQDKDWKAFLELLFLYRNTPIGFMPGFCEVAAVDIVLAVYSIYVNQLLQIRWRRWMTSKFLNEWLADRAYYHISLTVDRAAIGTDNPDQRIAEDLRDFTDNTLSLSLGLLSNLVSLFSFVGILWGLSGAIEVFGITHPRLHGLGRAGLCRGRHVADPPGRPAAGAAELPPAAGGGGFPLRPGAHPRKHGEHRPLPRRGRGRRQSPGTLCGGDRQLAPDHDADEAA